MACQSPNVSGSVKLVVTLGEIYDAGPKTVMAWGGLAAVRMVCQDGPNLASCLRCLDHRHHPRHFAAVTVALWGKRGPLSCLSPCTEHPVDGTSPAGSVADSWAGGVQP